MYRAQQFLFASMLLLSACTSDRLTYVTSSGVAAIEPILREQALGNLSTLLDDPSGVPSQVTFAQGQMQSNTQLAPSIGFPLSHTVQTVSSSNPSTTVSLAGPSASIAAQFQFNLQYQIVPVQQADQINNLRAIYTAVLCNSEQEASNGDLSRCQEALKNSYYPPRMIDSKNKLAFDRFYLYPPLCVLCIEKVSENAGNAIPAEGVSAKIACPPSGFKNDGDMTPLEIWNGDDDARSHLCPAPVFTVGWLRWKTVGIGTKDQPQSVPPKPNDIYLGEAGGRQFWADQHYAGEFAHLIMAMLPIPNSPAPQKPGSTTTQVTIVTPAKTTSTITTETPPAAGGGSTEGLKTPQLQQVLPVQ